MEPLTYHFIVSFRVEYVEYQMTGARQRLYRDIQSHSERTKGPFVKEFN